MPVARATARLFDPTLARFRATVISGDECSVLSGFAGLAG